MKTNNIKIPWIIVGYEMFAAEGPKGLKVEVMARRVQKSKSSFYHHFADLEVFMEVLLEYHFEEAKIIAVKENACKTVVPELLNVILEHKVDLLFNRQLRIHRNNPAFKNCFEKVNQLVGEAIIEIWAKMLGLNHNTYLAMMVLNLSIENFYLQITPETLNYEWLVAYVEKLQAMAKAFQNNN